MKAIKEHNPKREFVFVVLGIVLSIVFVLVCFFVIKSLVNRTKDVFGPPELSGDGKSLFDFDRYERLMGSPDSPTTISTTSTTETASSTDSAE